MAKLYLGLRRKLIQGFGVYVLMHTGTDGAKGERGHSSIKGWRDALIKLHPDKANLRVNVTIDPRSAAPPDPFVLKFEKGTVWAKDFSPHTAKIREYLRKQQGGCSDRKLLQAYLEQKDGAFREALSKAR